METENPKPQTGGLKLMTVFIVVLALHVAVIGGISAYHIFKRGSGDTAGDVTQKDTNVEAAEVAKPEVGPEPLQADANTPAPTATDAQVVDTTAAQPSATTTATAPATTSVPSAQPATAVTPTAPATEVKAPATEPTVKTSQVEVTVNKGDSLYKIARQNHVTVDAIKKLNGLTSDNLKIGQRLKVEVKGAAPAAVPAVSVPTSVATVAPKAKPVAAASTATVYTVSKGDTLTKIAKQFKTTPTAIMSANKMSDPSKLSIGAKLKIPGQQASAQPATTPEKAASAKPAPAQSSDLVMAR